MKDDIDIELTRRDAISYAEEHNITDAPIFLSLPSCTCGEGLDDSTGKLKCPVCGRPGTERRL